MQTHVFHDFDAFAESVRDANFEMLLQNPHRHRWNITHINLGGVHVQLGQEGSGNITEGQSLAEGFLLFIPFTNAHAHAANGKAFDENTIAILEPGCDFYLSSRIEHNWCSIFVPTEKFARGRYLSTRPSGSSDPKCLVVRPNGAMASRLRTVVDQIVTAAASCPRFESASAAEFAARQLLELAAPVVGRQLGQPNQAGRPRMPREEIIRRCKDLLEEREGQRVVLGELAAASQVSERTVRTAFKEYYGIGPMRYLQLRQLNQVHRALRAADPDAVSVSDVLAAHGEWEFSRTASRYRRLFGELPSETLRKRTL